MQQFAQYTILGLVLGGIYGIAASGLVLTYTTSGIFNFAHGAIAMLGAFSYWQLRVGWHWPAPLALVVVLGVVAPLFGALLHVTIMRGLRDTAEVTKIVVTVALMLGFVALSTWIWNPGVNQARVLDKFFGFTRTVTIFGSRITYHELIALGLAVVIALGLRFFFFRTRTGVAMRAVVDDPALLQLNGGRPERLATFSWALGAFLAALAGVLITPVLGGTLDANALTLLVIDAFAAAMFGRLRSVPRTFVGAAVLGLANNYVLAYFPTRWTWTTDFRISLPMIVLFAVLVLLRQDRLRGASPIQTRERFKPPTVRSAAAWGLVLVVVMFLLRGLMAATAVNTMLLGMTFAVVALSLVLLTGYAGEINLAALSFGGIGTLVVFHFGVHGTGLHARATPQGLLLAAVVCAVVGAIVALPALRLRGLYLALATMAFGVFVTNMILLDSRPRKVPLLHNRFTIFPNGTIDVPAPKLGPVDLRHPGTFLLAVTVLFAALGVLLVALRHSSYGRRLAAMRDSPAACATLGQNLVKLKLSVFMLSAAIAGVGGALMSAAIGSVDLNRFAIFLSLALLMLTVVGGIGFVSGALFGGVVSGVAFVAIQNTFTKLGTDHATLHGLFHFLAQLTLVAPAALGVGLGKNPSGVVSDVVAGYAPLRRARRVLAGGLALEALAYVLARAGAIGNWWFVIITGALFVSLPSVGKVLAPSAYAPAEESAPDVPLELIGVDRAFTEGDRALLDAALAIDTG